MQIYVVLYNPTVYNDQATKWVTGFQFRNIAAVYSYMAWSKLVLGLREAAMKCIPRSPLLGV